jgi:hypothetical protein
VSTLNTSPLPPSLDAGFLREEARLRAEQLAGARWTDYNTHDPGITILEVLAYAITDLGVRVRLDIPDLIAEGEATPFLTAQEVLPSAAFTPADFKRRLLDLADVRNAWISSDNYELAGVHALLLDLNAAPIEASGYMMDLNETWLRGIPSGNGQPSYDYYLVFPHWDTPESEMWQNEQSIESVKVNSFRVAEEEGQEATDRFSVGVYFNGDESLEQNFWIRLPERIQSIDYEKFKSHITNSENLSDPAFWESHRLRGVERKRILTENILPYVKKQRNLCEDWGAVRTIKIQQIGVKAAAIDLQPEADAEEVLTNIYRALSELIDPPVPRSSFSDWAAQGKSPAEIWQGPALQNGYIADEDLRSSARQELVYTSDIVRVIMEQPGVVGVRGLYIDHFMDRIKVASNVRNCLRLRNTREYKPKFSPDDTRLPVFKRGVEVAVNSAPIKDRILASATVGRPNTSSDDLTIAKGDAGLEIGTFYSIQHEFPAIYGLREGEISMDASSERQGRAKQLKAYLLFFEQLFSNYAAQLAHLQDLFSNSYAVSKTYFSQPLYDVPGVSSLLTDFTGGNASWNDFIQSHNQYVRSLENNTESDTAFLQRRNQFVNHLLARLGENFADYEAWSLGQNRGLPTPDLVYDKLAFLQNAVELSRDRALAFDITGQAWNSSDVSGYEKRVAALLGIPDCRRRSLSRQFKIEDHLEIYSQSGEPGQELAHFRIKSAAAGDPAPLSNQVVVSSKVKRLADEIPGLVGNILAEKAKNAENYSMIPATNSANVSFGIASELVVRHNYLSNKGLCFAAIREALHLFQGRQTEGMHVVEHILLRQAGGDLEPVIFPETGGEPFIPDPYPYQVSIFLPGWAPRFQQAEFRTVVERVLRSELPAHIFPYIFWVELDAQGAVPTEFTDFEAAWKAWLEQPEGGRLDELLDAINLLRTSPHTRLVSHFQSFDQLPIEL